MLHYTVGAQRELQSCTALRVPRLPACTGGKLRTPNLPCSFPKSHSILSVPLGKPNGEKKSNPFWENSGAWRSVPLCWAGCPCLPLGNL